MADYKVPSTPLVLAPPPDDRGKVQMAVDKMNELLGVQKKVDAAIEALPPGPDRDRLIKARSENRGFLFSQVVVPAWNKIKSWLGGSSTAAPLSGYGDVEPHEDGMGVLPLLIPAAVVAASTAILGYIGSNLYTEYKILNDPALTATQKYEIMRERSSGSITSALGKVQNIVLMAGLAVAAFYLYRARGTISRVAAIARRSRK